MAFSAFRRVPSPQRAAKQDNFKPKAFPSPTKGWLSAVNLADVPPGYAYTLENWFPTSTGIKLRGGNQKFATTGTTSQPLKSAMSYIGGTTRKMFAACNGKIFDVTTPVDNTTIPAAAVTGQTSDYYSYLNFATVGGNFMTVVNGSDYMQSFNGATWTQITAVSATAITGVATNLLSHVWSYRNRQWFVEAGTMRAWYLPVDSIGGAASSLSLAGVFQLGGHLVLGATWSTDTGNGLDDKVVFISSEGEYAIYQGSDPSSATTWSLVGRYVGSPPLGLNQNGYMRAGADLLILTEAGIVPMSAIQLKDPAALSLSAVSRAIAPDWVAEARTRRTLPWEIIKWPSRQMAIVNCPVTGPTTPAISFVVNLETGAWCKYTGWDTRCLVLHDDYVYFGTNTGTLQQADITGADDGALIYHTYIGHFDHLGAIGYNKTVIQARATFRTFSTFIPQLSVSTDYVLDLPTPPNAAVVSDTSGVWDVGLWDVALWDTGQSYSTFSTRWVSIGQSGESHAPQVQVTSGSTSSPSAELILLQVISEQGGLVL